MKVIEKGIAFLSAHEGVVSRSYRRRYSVCDIVQLCRESVFHPHAWHLLNIHA